MGTIPFREVILPLKDTVVESLHMGERILLSGVLYTARDVAHRRIVESLKKGEALPITLNNQTIYYTGPTPAPPGLVIGSCGPTTSSRMDFYTPLLLKQGLKGMIGKGARSNEVKEAIKKYRAVYFVATGGAGALLAKRVKECEVVAYPDLGCEAIHRLVVENFPVIVAIDVQGRDIYQRGIHNAD